MESGGMIRCTQCGYKNSPVYHYCGVCGAVLQAAKEDAPGKPVPVTSTPVTAPIAVEPVVPPPAASVAAPPLPPPPPRTERADLPVSGGMSFLGLSDSSSSSSPSYLLDDEEEGERSVAWGRILFVLILLGAVGGLGWQYHVHGYPFAPQNQVVATPATPANPTPAPTDSSAAPATSSSTTPAPSAENPAPDASKPAETTASAPATTTESTPPAAAKTETTPVETKPAEPTAAEKTEPAPEKTAPVEKAEKVVPTRPKTPPPAPEPAVSPGESLYIQGQRYLYGNGVTANCDLALKSLLSSAGRQNSKAQSTLGAMYSTGHCVSRDLPTAYKWFAKALHQDPNNTRLEQDLSVVWKQMTPGERQTATKSD